MYIPKHYLAKNKEEIIQFMQQYSFATIITAGNNIPVATHLPFVVETKNDKIILFSHFARANAQWKTISTSEILVVFQEPNAYISPRYYEQSQNVPTWNYVAVHAYGKGKVINDKKEGFQLLEKMILLYEQEYKEQWDHLAEAYKQKLYKGIVPIEIEVTRLQGKKKLSQNRSAVEKQNIINAFERSPDKQKQTIAELMKKERASSPKDKNKLLP